MAIQREPSDLSRDGVQAAHFSKTDLNKSCQLFVRRTTSAGRFPGGAFEENAEIFGVFYSRLPGDGFDGEIGFRTNVRAFIKRIRQKFRDVDPKFSQIKNYPGFGYRWLDGPEQ